MNLVGLVQKQPLHEANGTFDAMFEFETPPSGDEQTWGIYVRNVAALQTLYPYLYVLTNIRTSSDPQPRWYGQPTGLQPDVLAHHPHARLGLDYFSTNLPRQDQLAYLIEFGKEVPSPFCHELLGLVPPPAYADLLLADEEGMCGWVATTTPSSRDRTSWESQMLGRFAVLFHVHEGWAFILRTKQRSVLESLGAGAVHRA
ncbi:MAG TPA: hypothetical protein VEY12_08675 [Thermoplasmata archaeon]|nr:hypothetical protein [Thermoplasmata archaeon]